MGEEKKNALRKTRNEQRSGNNRTMVFFHLQRLPLCLVTIYIEFTLYTLLEIISSYLLDGSGCYSVNSSWQEHRASMADRLQGEKGRSLVSVIDTKQGWTGRAKILLFSKGVEALLPRLWWFLLSDPVFEWLPLSENRLPPPSLPALLIDQLLPVEFWCAYRELPDFCCCCGCCGGWAGCGVGCFWGVGCSFCWFCCCCCWWCCFWLSRCCCLGCAGGASCFSWDGWFCLSCWGFCCCCGFSDFCCCCCCPRGVWDELTGAGFGEAGIGAGGGAATPLPATGVSGVMLIWNSFHSTRKNKFKVSYF